MAETLHIYTRVSTVVQADEGMSLDVQRDIGIEPAQRVWDSNSSFGTRVDALQTTKRSTSAPSSPKSMTAYARA